VYEELNQNVWILATPVPSPTPTLPGLSLENDSLFVVSFVSKLRNLPLLLCPADFGSL